MKIDLGPRWPVRVRLLFLGGNRVGPPFDPDNLTALIGLNAASSWRVGDPRGRRLLPAKTCGWELAPEEGSGPSLGDQIDGLLSRIRGHEAGFKEAATAYRVELDCYLRANPAGSAPELRIAQEQMRALVELNVSAVGFDIGL